VWQSINQLYKDIKKMKLKLLKDFRGYAKGKTIHVTGQLGEELIKDKIAEAEKPPKKAKT